MKRLLLFACALGLVLGVVGTLLAPRLVRPLLPEAIRGSPEVVSGMVLKERREPEQLLLTLDTPRGAILAIFRKDVTEVDLLVDQGDSIGLALRRYEPFVRNPEIRRVGKNR
ncbi:MAG: hypothetical protein HY702_02440 [Gemmatimonadetes bacterium]|nr:hypothetical protein [Gemmatimonadota bacterium]